MDGKTKDDTYSVTSDDNRLSTACHQQHRCFVANSSDGLFPAYSASQLPALVAYKQQVLSRDQYKHLYLYPFLFLLLICLFAVNHLMNGPTWVYALIGAGFFITLLLGLPAYLHLFIKIIGRLFAKLFGGDGLIAVRMSLRQIRKSQFISGILMVTVILTCVGSMLLDTVLSRQRFLSDLQEE